VTHGREDALVHALGTRGIRGRALHLIGRGEEDEAEEPLSDAQPGASSGEPPLAEQPAGEAGA